MAKKILVIGGGDSKGRDYEARQGRVGLYAKIAKHQGAEVTQALLSDVTPEMLKKNKYDAILTEIDYDYRVDNIQLLTLLRDGLLEPPAMERKPKVVMFSGGDLDKLLIPDNLKLFVTKKINAQHAQVIADITGYIRPGADIIEQQGGPAAEEKSKAQGQ